MRSLLLNVHGPLTLSINLLSAAIRASAFTVTSLMWGQKQSFDSRITPRYFAVGLVVTNLDPTYIGSIVGIALRVNSTTSVFVSAWLSPCFVIHLVIRFITWQKISCAKFAFRASTTTATSFAYPTRNAPSGMSRRSSPSYDAIQKSGRKRD